MTFILGLTIVVSIVFIWIGFNMWDNGYNSGWEDGHFQARYSDQKKKDEQRDEIKKV